MSEKTYLSLTAEDCAKKLLSWARENKKIMILAHKNPDGDCVGSALSLKKIYEALSGRAFCYCNDKIPQYLSFMTLEASEGFAEEQESYDIIVTVDTASPSQMGDLEPFAPVVSLAIDHHASYTQYSDEYRDEKASAAGEMVFNIYEYLKNEGYIEEDPDIARLLYCAISADSGSFMYSNTTKKTHIIASKLIGVINSDEKGINTAEIARRLHNSKSLNALKAEKLCIESLELAEEGKIAYVVIEYDKMKDEGLRHSDLGACVDIPRSIENVLLSFVLKEQGKVNDKREYRISARSSCDVSVSDICQKFGGGGHQKAAGGSIIAKNANEAKEAVLKEFIKALTE